MHMEQSHMRMGLSHTRIYSGVAAAAAAQQLQYTRMGQAHTRMGHSHMRMHGTIEQSHAYTSMDCPIC